MLKDAIEKIEDMATKPMVREINGTTYIIDKDGDFKPVLPPVITPSELKLHSLDALVKMIKTEAMKGRTPIYVEVSKATFVEAFRQPEGEDKGCVRPTLYSVVAQDVPGWEPEVSMAFEKAAVALQTRFQDGGDKDYALRLLSQISTGAKVTYNDTGIATTVVTQKGVALQGTESIRPVVKLKPYRTFQEVEQPDGLFLIRITEHGISFTEADGGMWKLCARQTVAKYLSEALEPEINCGRVVVML